MAKLTSLISSRAIYGNMMIYSTPPLSRLRLHPLLLLCPLLSVRRPLLLWPHLHSTLQLLSHFLFTCIYFINVHQGISNHQITYLFSNCVISASGFIKVLGVIGFAINRNVFIVVVDPVEEFKSYNSCPSALPLGLIY